MSASFAAFLTVSGCEARLSESRGKDEREDFASLLEDAVSAIDDVQTKRFHATVRQIGSSSESAQYIYLFENTSRTRSHMIVPLFEMKKGVQFNMDVRDGGEKKLIYLDSAFCREAALNWALQRFDRIESYFRKYGKPLALKRKDVELAIAPPTFDKATAEKHTAASSNAINHLAALLHSIPRTYLDIASEKGELYRDLPPKHQERATDSLTLHRDVSYLVTFLKLHEEHYIPLVLLSTKLDTPGGHGRHVALVKHVVQSATVEELITFPPAQTWGEKVRQGIAKVALYTWWTVVLSLAGWAALILNAVGLDRHVTSVPLNTRAESSHLKFRMGEGFSLLAISPRHLPRRMFKRDNDGDQWAREDDHSRYFYRRKEQIQRYQAKLQEKSGDGRERSSLSFVVWGFEGGLVLFWFAAAVILAALWSVGSTPTDVQSHEGSTAAGEPLLVLI